MFYDEDNVQGDRAWCERWDEYVRGDYYCNAWQPDDDDDDDDERVTPVDFETRATPPNYMQAAADRGLELRAEGFGGDGVTDKTVREARAMADGVISDDKIVRAFAWSQRHAIDLDAPQNRDPNNDDFPGAGAVAHYLWGINPTDPRPAIRWLERESNRLQGRTTMSDVEIRTFNTELTEVRAEGAGNGMTFGGFAWRYGEPSLPLPFTERIAPGAFTRTLKSKNDIRAYYNHNDELLLGSSRAKTLRIDDRSEGGYVEIDLPETELGRSTAYHIRVGNITGMSFGFSTVRDAWSGDGAERTLNEVRLHEVSVVSGVPAYPTTTASVRNIRVIAKRSDIDADILSDAISALEAGDLNDDQANLLRTVVDRATGVVVDDPTAPMSILKDKLSLYEKFLSL
jgi:HK97 family phage prohead protease